VRMEPSGSVICGIAVLSVVTPTKGYLIKVAHYKRIRRRFKLICTSSHLTSVIPQVFLWQFQIVAT
jgi:hypothetical protein